MIPKDPPPTHLLSGEARSRQSSRKAIWVPSPKEGGWRKEGPVPNPSSVVTTPVGPWGGNQDVPRLPHQLCLLPELPRLCSVPVTPGTPEWSLKAHLLPPTPSCPTLHRSPLHPGAKEAPSRAVPRPLGDVALLLFDGTLFKHSPKSPAHTKGVSWTEPGGFGTRRGWAGSLVQGAPTGLTMI